MSLGAFFMSGARQRLAVTNAHAWPPSATRLLAALPQTAMPRRATLPGIYTEAPVLLSSAGASLIMGLASVTRQARPSRADGFRVSERRRLDGADQAVDQQSRTGARHTGTSYAFAANRARVRSCTPFLSFHSTASFAIRRKPPCCSRRACQAFSMLRERVSDRQAPVHGFLSINLTVRVQGEITNK